MAERLVWGKISLYPWWPGKVVADGEGTASCWVEFFDEEKSVERMSADRVKDFVENRDKLLTAGLKRCLTPTRKSRFEMAVSIADKMAAHGGEDNPDTPTEVSTHSSSDIASGVPATEQEVDKAKPNGGDKVNSTLRDVSVSSSPLKQADIATNSASSRSIRARRITHSVQTPPVTSKPATVRKNKRGCVPGDGTPETAAANTGRRKIRPEANQNATELAPTAAKTPKGAKKNMSSTKNGASYERKSTAKNSKCAVKGSPIASFRTTNNTPGRPRKQLILPTMSSSPSPQVCGTNSDSPLLLRTPRELRPHTALKEQLESTQRNVEQAASASSCGTTEELTEQTSLREDATTNGNTPTVDTLGEHVESPVTDGASSTDDEDLPSFALEAPSFNIALGSIVWVKMRKYPHWPCLVSRINDKRKKAAIKFINSDNVTGGLWMKMSHISEYPGSNFADYEAAGRNNLIYSAPLTKAIKLVNSYLHDKCKDESLDPFSYFFPGQAGDNDVPCVHTPGSSELDTSSDFSIRCVDSDTKLQWMKQERRAPQYSDDTLLRIQEREGWLKRIVGTLREDQSIQKKLTKYIKDGGKQLTPLASRQSFLGPLVCSTKHLGADFLDLIVSLYELETKSMHMPAWCYESLIPKAVIECIAKVDKISLAAAKDKFFADLRTEEEDDHYHKQIISHTERLTEEEDLHYKMLANDSF